MYCQCSFSLSLDKQDVVGQYIPCLYFILTLMLQSLSVVLCAFANTKLWIQTWDVNYNIQY